MPSAIKYIPLTDTRRNHLYTLAFQERTTRTEKYRTALQYYNGSHPEQLAYKRNEPNDNTIINLVKMTADRVGSFLFPSLPRFVTDKKTSYQSPEEKIIYNVLDSAGGLQFLVRWALRGFLSGHTYLRVSLKRGKINVTLLQPTAVVVYWSADDVSNILWYENKFNMNGYTYVEDIVKQEDDTWVIYTYKSKQTTENGIENINTPAQSNFYGVDYTNNSWEQLGSPAKHPHEIAPIIDTPHLPNPNDFYGLEEPSDYKLQDKINRVISELMKIVGENASPKDVITGSSANEVQSGDGIYVVPEATARVTRLSMSGELKPITDLFQTLMETYLSLMRVVILKGEVKDLQRVTNNSVQMLFLDMITKNNILKDSYGRSLKKLSMLILWLSGYNKDYELEIRFSSALPQDKQELINFLSLALDKGIISKYTATTELSYNPEEEREYIRQELEEEAALQKELNREPEQPIDNTDNDVNM
jgi:hypothetical protein